MVTSREDPLGYAAPQASVTDYATVTADDLITGEAVALDVPPASLGTRMVSGLIDILATVAVAIAITFVFLLAASWTNEALFHVALVGSMIVIFLVWPTTFETLSRGRSPGKYAMGLRTVRDDGGPIAFQHAFVRALIGYVEIYVFAGGPAFLAAMLSTRGKRLGDYAAGTYVVRERVRLELPPPVQMPPPLGGWAYASDLAPLPTGLALAVRQFLGRAPRMDQRSRGVVAQRLAGEVSAYVAPPPPPGTPPEAFLAAVVTERRRRDGERLAREDGVRRRLTARR